MVGKTFWDWVIELLQRYWPLFVRGTANTLLLAIVGTAAGLVIGLLIGTARSIPKRRGGEAKFSPRAIFLKVVDFILAAYVEIFRGTPMMVQAILFYYGLQEVYSIEIPSMTAGLLVISLNTGAYMSEIVRGGIQSVPAGQSEAARAIGMTHWQTMLYVVLPQAIRNILPATGNEFVVNIKDSSVLNVIQVSELFLQAKTIKGVFLRTYETFFITALIYLLLTFISSRLLHMLEKRMDGPENFSLIASSTTVDLVKRHHGAGARKPYSTKQAKK